MSFIALFDIIYGSQCTILANFYLYYLQYFEQKVFNFNKISESQIDTKYELLVFALGAASMAKKEKLSTKKNDPDQIQKKKKKKVN